MDQENYSTKSKIRRNEQKLKTAKNREKFTLISETKINPDNYSSRPRKLSEQIITKTIND